MRLVTATAVFIFVNVSTAFLLLGTGISAEASFVQDFGGVENIDAYAYSDNFNSSNVSRPNADLMFDRKVSTVASGNFDATRYYGSDTELEPKNYVLYRIDNLYSGAERYQLFSEEGLVKGQEAELVLSYFTWTYAVNQSFNPEKFDEVDEKKQGETPSGIHNRETAEEALEDFSYRKAFEEAYSQEQVDALENISQTSSGVSDTVTPLKQATGAYMGIVEEMKNLQVAPGRSVWDAATLASPSLETATSAVDTLDTELEEWRSAAVNLTESSRGLADDFEDYGRNDEVDEDAVENLRNLQTDIDTFSTKTQELQSLLETARTGLEPVREKASDFPIVGDRMAGAIDSLDSEVESAIEAANKVQSQLEAQEGRIESLEELQSNAYRDKKAELENELSVYSNWKEKLKTDEEARSALNSFLVWLSILAVSSVLLLRRAFKSTSAVISSARNYLEPESKDEIHKKGNSKQS